MISRPALSEIELPPFVWIDDSPAEDLAGITAAEAIRRDEDRLGVSFGIAAEALVLLALAPAASLLWVTFKRSHAARRFRKVRELALNDVPVVILATDHEGGFLLWFPTNPEDENMSIFDELKARLTGASERFHILDQETQEPGGAMDAETAVRTFVAQIGYAVRTFDDPTPYKIGIYARPEGPAAALAEGGENSFRDIAMNFVESGAFVRTFGPAPERPTDPTPPQGKTLDESHIVLSDAMKESAAYVGVDRQMPTEPTPFNHRAGYFAGAVAPVAGQGPETSEIGEAERFEPRSWEPGDYTPSARERASMLNTLREVDPEAPVQAVMQEEADEFDHTPVEGPVSEALHCLWHSNHHGDQYPETIGEALSILERDPPDSPWIDHGFEIAINGPNDGGKASIYSDRQGQPYRMTTEEGAKDFLTIVQQDVANEVGAGDLPDGDYRFAVVRADDPEKLNVFRSPEHDPAQSEAGRPMSADERFAEAMEKAESDAMTPPVQRDPSPTRSIN